MHLTMLGTGHAMVTECYNTCFVIRDGESGFLVDGGGGNGVLHQLQAAGIDWRGLRSIFVTHKHIDHLLGAVWMIRLICRAMAQGSDAGPVDIYGHEEVTGLLRELAEKLLAEKETRFLGTGVRLVTVTDGETRPILGRETAFFDLGSTKARQFGFCMDLGGGERLTCCGDEPCPPRAERYARGSKWLLHEAFCLESQKERFTPHEKHHSTVADACRLAERLEVRNLLLYHTEDTCLKDRRRLYQAEGRQFYSGGLYIPEDLETIEL